MVWENAERHKLGEVIWKLISQNFWLKALSVVFAVILFLSVRTEQVKEVTRWAKVRIVTGNKVMVVGSQERAVYVTVKLPNSLFVKQPEERDFLGEFDARNSRVGKVRVRLSSENFPALESEKRYTVVIHDPWIEFELDNVYNKDLDVRPQVEGQPRDGFVVEKVIVSPEQVEVTGAKRELSSLSSLTTSVINIDGIDKTFSSRTKIAIDENSSIKLKDEWVNVQVVVGQQRLVRVFQSVPVEPVGGNVAEVRPTHLDVELTGEKRVLDGLRGTDLRAFVDVRRLSPGWQEKAVKLQIPPDTSLVRVVPATVSVRSGK